MLILSRKVKECIIIDGRILVKIMRVEGDCVKIGIEAPAHVPVHRQEVYEEIQQNNQQAVTTKRPSLPWLKAERKSKCEPAAPLPKARPGTNPTL
jgi:carbon storage regulator